MFKIDDIRKLYEEIKDYVIDILVFGSAVKGKEKPFDIDIIIIIKDKKYFKEVLDKISGEYDYVVLTLEDIIYSDFLLKKVILPESISIKTGKKFSELLFGNSYMIYELYLQNESESKRVLLYYFLKGRKNILAKINGELLKLEYKEHSEQPTYTVKIPLQYSSYFEEELKKYCENRLIKLKVIRRIIIDAETTFI